MDCRVAPGNDEFLTPISNMTNLVIGSEGFIGKYFCNYLIGLGEKVVHFDIKKDKK